MSKSNWEGRRVTIKDIARAAAVDPSTVTRALQGSSRVKPATRERIAALALEMGCEVRDIAETVHAHPTMGETLMNAGEVFYGTATEIYKPRKKPAPAG